MHTSCIVVSSHPYTINTLIQTLISTFHLLEDGIPQINQQSHQSPPLVALAATQEVGETVSLIVVACREQLPRFCTLTALWTLSSILLPLVPSFISILELLFHQAQHHPLQSIFSPRHTAPPPHIWNLDVFQNATETIEPILNCHCNRYPCCSREERYASQVINIKAESARPILLHHA